MKYRIVKYNNGLFGIQEKFLFWWLGSLDGGIELVFGSLSEAKSRLRRLRDNGPEGFTVSEVMEEHDE